jgi:hypothetical protein
MYYNKRFTDKPNGYEIAEVQKNLVKTNISIENLANGLSHGATFKPALLNGRKSVDWVSQQLFALDFDHETTIQEQLNKCKELSISPCFGYTSFSHTEQEHHFRLVFCTDTVITDIETRNKLQNTLISLFDKSDNVTKDCTRIFFGGRSLICDTYNNRINAKQIIDKYYKEDLQNPKKITEPKTCKKKLNYYSNKELLNENIEAIKHLDVVKMRELLDKNPINNPTTIEVHSQDELFKFINAIDLSEYLGVEYGEKFSCILPEHEDNSPSACIWTTDDGTQIYKCFGCGHAFTIISLTEKLAQCSRSKAIEFIKSVYGITLYESDWTKQWKQKLIDYANYLDSKELEVTFPELSTLIRTRKCHMKSILLYFSTLVNEDMQINGNPFFFSSYDKLMQVCGIKPNRRIVLSQSLVLFSLLNMINKMQVKAIPEKELHKAQQIAIACGHKKLTGFYSFNEYGVMSFSNSEEIAKTLKENHVTLKGLSREYVLRTFGIEVANKVYSQYKFENSKGTSEKSDNATLELINKLCNIINEKGYCLESDIRGKGQTELQWKRSIAQILSVGKFQKIRLNKKIKAQYNVVCNGYPFIIVNK